MPPLNMIGAYTNQPGVHPSVRINNVDHLLHHFKYIGRIVHEVEKACQVQEPQLLVQQFLVISPDYIW